MKNIILLCSFLFSFILLAQTPPEEEDKENRHAWRIGGGFGLGGGSNNSWNIGISPTIGYVVAENKLEIGATTGYRYVSYLTENINLFSIGAFTNVIFAKHFFMRTHYEYYTGTIKVSGTKTNHDENVLYVGGGYMQRFDRIILYTGLLYNVLYNKENSIFSNGFNPFISMVYAF